MPLIFKFHPFVTNITHFKTPLSQKLQKNKRFLMFSGAISPAIRQKGESQNKYFKKTKQAKFSEKRGKEIFVFGKFGVLCFLETPALRLTFCLITNDIIETLVNIELTNVPVFHQSAHLCPHNKY